MGRGRKRGKRAAARISLCMIVRDEAEFLARCLTSAAAWVDEICVVDTGSRDETVAIAEGHGARVERIVWPDSFAEARNASLELARGDWVLVLDADEELQPGSGEALRALTRQEHLLGALLRLENEGREGHAWVRRFFRNHPEHRYERAIHEQLGAGFEARVAARGRCIAMSERARILHRGYSAEVMARRGKRERMQRLYDRAVAERPEDVYLAYKHAEFLRADPEARGRGEARAALLRAVVLSEALPPGQAARFSHCSESFALLAWDRLEAGELLEARDVLERGLAQCTPTAHLYFAQGLCCLRETRWQLALDAFRACREVSGAARMAAALPGVTTWKSAVGMADALVGLGRADEAAQQLQTELARGCGEASLVARTAELLAEAGRLSEALSVCTTELRRSEQAWRVWWVTADLLRRSGQAQVARNAAQKALHWAPAEARAGVQSALSGLL